MSSKKRLSAPSRGQRANGYGEGGAEQTVEAILKAPLSSSGPSGSIGNDQLLKLIIQYLGELGGPFGGVSESLSQLTGLNLTDEHTDRLISLLKDTSFGPEDDNYFTEVSQVVERLFPGENSQIIQETVNTLIKKRLFLESLILEKNRTKSLRILRSLNSQGSANALSRKLSSLLVDLSEYDNEAENGTTKLLLDEVGWVTGSDYVSSRANLVEEVVKLLPADKFIPAHRLTALVQQSQAYQQSNSPYYQPTRTASKDITLFHDISKDYGKEKLPRHLKYRLEDHSNECWFVRYSHNGRFLASASVDKTVVIHDTQDRYKIYKQLIGHFETIIYLSWSRDDTKVITSSFDQTVKVWDVETGITLATISNKDFFNSNLRLWSIEFFSNSDQFVLGSIDKKLSIYNLDGELVYDFEIEHRVDDLTILNDEKLLVITRSCQLLVYDLTTPNYKLASAVTIGKKLTSITKAAGDTEHCLINVKSDELQLWNVANPARPYLVNKYFGLRQSDYIIRGCLTDNNLVLSGSEDGLIYIWNKKFGNLVECLEGHKSLVNCIDWRPVGGGGEVEGEDYEWASCGDDGIVNIWGTA